MFDFIKNQGLAKILTLLILLVVFGIGVYIVLFTDKPMEKMPAFLLLVTGILPLVLPTQIGVMLKGINKEKVIYAEVPKQNENPKEGDWSTTETKQNKDEDKA